MKRVFSRKKNEADQGQPSRMTASSSSDALAAGTGQEHQPPSQQTTSSSASILSQPLTVSTAPSSVFSRAASSSMRTMSSYGSGASHSHSHKKFEGIQEEPLEEQLPSTSTSRSKAVRLVNQQEMDTLVEEPSTVPVASPIPRRQARNTPYTHAVLLPDMPITGPPSADHLAKLMESSHVSNHHGSRASSSGSGSGQRRTTFNLSAKDILRELAEEVSSHIEQYRMGRIDLVRTAQAVNKTLRAASFPPFDGEFDQFDSDIQKILKYVLHLTDNLLRSPQHQPLKMYILRALTNVGIGLKLIPSALDMSSPAMVHPRNFAVGHAAKSSPAEEVLTRVMNTIVQANQGALAEQEGAFVAPLLRGPAPTFAILTLSFGFPHPEISHYERIASLFPALENMHAYCQRNYISVCSTRVESAVSHEQQRTALGSKTPTFTPPYRVPDGHKPPISVSIATENATSLSGTLGGYICPRIDVQSNPALADYASSTFAITCAHVCLSENNARSTYPFVSTPSPVLVNIYKNALITERNKYETTSMEAKEYERAISELETSNQQSVSNMGQVVWGERVVVNGSMSDIAIVRVNQGIECQNYLGDDVPFSSFDPGLMFSNLYVKRTVKKLTPGMTVFKYGSTSKYTSGRVNGPRLVYWADGALQSSEFVVSSDVPGFASGGDSGAWILHKGSRQSGQPHGLGVVGMLHSYDGEHRELGLFTPINSLLSRIEEVTNIKWGIVGVPNDDELVGGSDTDISTSDETENY